VHVVQVCPANQAECLERVGIKALGHRLCRELPELDTGLQRDFKDGSEHCLGSADDIGRGKEPHSVHEPDQALLIASERDLVTCVRAAEGPGRGRSDDVHPELAALYTQACEKRVEAMENDLLEIADDTDRDYREGKNGKDIPNKEQMLRSKIRIESRQWLMARRDPQQWGDKQSLDVSANIMLLTPEERVQKALQLFDLMEKFVERERNSIADQPLVYDPGGDLPVLVIDEKSGFGRD
jgi:hypothetical protein